VFVNKIHKKTGREMSSKGLCGQKGSVTIIVAVAMFAIFAFAVLAIDGALLLTTRTQLHNAADAAALAGASGLLEGSQATAIERAINFASYNSALQVKRVPVAITAGDISFPEPDKIRVTTHRTQATGDALKTYFQRVISPFSSADVKAVAAAKIYDVCGGRCLKPWSIPDRWDDANNNGAYDEGEYYDPIATGYQVPVDVGADIVLKVGNPQEAIEPGVFFPVNFPPLNYESGEDPLEGANWYETWIAECTPYLVNVGDQLQIEPGNMVGPTRHGMEELIAQDPGAYWDPASKTVKGSAYGLSPRIGLIPFFDPTLPPGTGRHSGVVTVVKLGAFFIESIGPGSQVNGRFIQITTQGTPCPGGTASSFVKTIVLVE
jgi:Flp pilus assembly protein TadG